MHKTLEKYDNFSSIKWEIRKKKQKEIQNFRNGLKNFTTTPMTSLENKKKTGEV